MDRAGVVIRGGAVFDARRPVPIRADVLIWDDEIVAVAPSVSVPAGAIEIDATGMLVVPGLVNAHTHAHNNLSRSVADNLHLEDLRGRAPGLAGRRTPEEQYVSAALGAIEMVKTGCTAAFDQFASDPLSPRADEAVAAVVQAYADVGLRAVLAPVVTDESFYRSIPGLYASLPTHLRGWVDRQPFAPPERILGLLRHTIRRWHGAADGRVTIALAPSVPAECSDALLRGCRQLVHEFGVTLQTHLVESKVQAVAGARRWGSTVLRHLADLELLGPKFVGGHGVWLSDDDLRLLAETGSCVAHNPASNLKLGNGIAPIRELIDRGVTVGLGSDGSMTSDNQNMFEAMRFAALVGNIRYPYQTDRWISAREAWTMATTAGSRVLGLGESVGEVAPGRKADLTILRSNSTFLTPLNDATNCLVYSETGASVRSVLVDGRLVVDHGRVLTVDEDRLLALARDAASASTSRNRSDLADLEEIAPYVDTACRSVSAEAFSVDRYGGRGSTPLPS